MAAKDVTEEQRREIVRQIGNGETQKSMAMAYDCSQATIASWCKKYGAEANGVSDEQTTYGIDPEVKLSHIIATADMDDDAIEDYANEHEVTVSAINEWREAALSGLSDRDQSEFSDPVSAMNKAMQQIQRENRALHSRLERIKSI